MPALSQTLPLGYDFCYQLLLSAIGTKSQTFFGFSKIDFSFFKQRPLWKLVNLKRIKVIKVWGL